MKFRGNKAYEFRNTIQKINTSTYPADKYTNAKLSVILFTIMISLHITSKKG